MNLNLRTQDLEPGDRFNLPYGSRVELVELVELGAGWANVRLLHMPGTPVQLVPLAAGQWWDVIRG